MLSAFLIGIPEHKLRVIAPEVGGGFGSKIPTYPEEALVPWATRKVGRPVKWVASRSESAMSDTQGRDHVTIAKLALKKDGTITALRVSTWTNNGAYISLVASLILTAFYITLLSGLYKIPASAPWPSPSPKSSCRPARRWWSATRWTSVWTWGP